MAIGNVLFVGWLESSFARYADTGIYTYYTYTCRMVSDIEAGDGRDGACWIRNGPTTTSVVVAVAKGWSRYTDRITDGIVYATKYILPTWKSSCRRAKQMQLGVGTRSSPVAFILFRGRFVRCAATFRKSPHIPNLSDKFFVSDPITFCRLTIEFSIREERSSFPLWHFSFTQFYIACTHGKQGRIFQRFAILFDIPRFKYMFWINHRFWIWIILRYIGVYSKDIWTRM